jgi:hypothetical protein
MKAVIVSLSLFLASLVAVSAFAGDTPSAEGAEVYIINLSDGDRVKSPVLVQFGLRGMGVAPAGVPDLANTGHHHLVIDEKVEGRELDLPLPKNEKHIHFGGGQTEAMVELAPGEHTLTLVLADWKHTPHSPPVISKPIRIVVE